MLKAKFTIDREHPSLPGHFPGSPIAPGVVTLDYVARNLLAKIPGMYVCGFPQVKFIRPVLPSIEVEVIYKKKNDSLYQFQCEINAETVVTGQIRLAMKEDSCD